MKTLAIFLSLLLSVGCSSLKDDHKNINPNFNPVILNPAYLLGTGPNIYIDEGHNNYHTMSGKYEPFAILLRKDGYSVYPNKKRFTIESLKSVDVLVIVNAIHKDNLDSWTLPTPSAFIDSEIMIVNDWVKDGGALLLITDHMPLPGAAKKLASSFGFILNNGHAHGPDNNRHIRFSRNNQTLRKHVITNGFSDNEKIQSVYTYSGDAFQIPPEAESLLVFREGSYSLNPQKAFKFDKETQKINISGWSHGAVRKYGLGRIALLGESGAFTAQIIGKEKTKVGMNSPNAPDNQQFVLNIVHWLSGKLID